MIENIWNPWHGCRRFTEGCQNCYMYYLDAQRGRDGSHIYRVKNDFDLPLKKDRNGQLKIRSGEKVNVCLTSDFFLEEADEWRDEAWNIMLARPDLHFFILTKRAHRIADCLPIYWGDGMNNVTLSVSTENQKRADERIPILLSIPAKHRGIMAAPLLGQINIEAYLANGMIDYVLCDGENYDGARECRYEWVKDLSEQCRRTNTRFTFCGTGMNFSKDGRVYRIPRDKCHSQAVLSGLSFEGREIRYFDNE